MAVRGRKNKSGRKMHSGKHPHHYATKSNAGTGNIGVRSRIPGR